MDGETGDAQRTGYLYVTQNTAWAAFQSSASHSPPPCRLELPEDISHHQAVTLILRLEHSPALQRWTPVANGGCKDVTGTWVQSRSSRKTSLKANHRS